MLKLSTISLTLALFVGAAFAQQPAPAPKAGAPAQPPATKPAPPAGVTPKPPTTTPPATTPPATTVAPAVAPKPPQAPQEIVDLAKAMNGAWKCTGKADIAGTTVDVKATITHKANANLNKFWIETSFVGTAKKMPPLKFTQYMKFDPTTKKLVRFSFNGMGGHSMTSATYDAKKLAFEGESNGMMGTVKVRHTEEFISPKEVKVTGEVSKDGGKTWVFDHEASCKK